MAIVLALAAGASAAEPLGELAAFADRDGCAAAREFSSEGPGDPSAPGCTPMRRQTRVGRLVASPDGRRLYSLDTQSESVVAYKTLAGGGIRELNGPGSCVALSGARERCRLGRGVEERGRGSAAISPDGRFLYVGSTVGPAPTATGPPPRRVAVIEVIGVRGGLRRVGCVSSDGTNGRGAAVCTAVRGLETLWDLDIGPDGQTLYATSAGYTVGPEQGPPDAGIAVLRRDPESGALTQLDGPAGCLTRTGAAGACAAEPSLEGLTELVLGPAGRAAYATSMGGGGANGGAFVLRRDQASGAIELARGPGTCIGALAGRIDCTEHAWVEEGDAASLAPDGRFLYVSSLNNMALLAVDESAATLSVAGCISPLYPRECTRVRTDASEGARLTFSPDGRTALMENVSEIETLARDPATGAVTSRGCISANGSDTCSVPVVSLATTNLAFAPDGSTVYAGDGPTIYALAPGATVGPATTARVSSRGTVPVTIRCDAPRARGCHGTLELDDHAGELKIARVRLSIAGGRSGTVRVPLSASARRAIARRRRVVFEAIARIGAPEGRSLESARTLRVDAASGARAPSCRSGGVRTLLRTGRLRVYTVRTVLYHEVYERTYACLFAAGRQVPLDEPDYIAAGKPFTLVGTRLAYEYTLGPDAASDGTTYVRVVDLRNGRELRAACASIPEYCRSDSGTAEVRVIVMLPSGGFAWTAASGPEHFVVKADAGGEPRLLDQAEGRIRLDSLRLSGNRLTWMHGEKKRSAKLR